MRSTDPDFETKAADVIGLGGAVQGIRLRPRRVLIDLALERFDILLGEYDPRWRRGDRATSVRD